MPGSSCVRLIERVNADSVERLRAATARCYGVPAKAVGVVRAPYRLCPLGAHIDHQLGPVSALAVDRGILMGFVANEEGRIHVRSESYPGTISFPLNETQTPAGDWADYARGAVAALNGSARLRQGVSLYIHGHLSEAGLSSSAAVGLGYLLAIASVNGLRPLEAELIELDRLIENEFLGLMNGVLDPSAIALGRAGELTLIDCLTSRHRHVAQPEPFEFLAVFSGLKASLIGSGKFNERVTECLAAGAWLSNQIRGTNLERCPLGRLSDAEWHSHGEGLDARLRRRATHFFTERERVLAGAGAWAASDHQGFGQLMQASGLSSIHNYETGSAEMIRLFEVLNQTAGVFGARFSGAGFRGCAVALVEAGRVEEILDQVEAAYLGRFPHLRDSLWAFSSRAAAGLERV